MDNRVQDGDRLYLVAERLAREFDIFPTADPDSEFHVEGLLAQADIDTQNLALDRMDIDSYIEAVVSSAEKPDREDAVSVIRSLGTVLEETSQGPYYEAVLEMQFDDRPRAIGFIAQDRKFRNGEWMPEHHFAAAQFARRCCLRRMPIVSFMDTPGAAGDEVANRNNQAHNISRLIAEMSDVDVPNVGIIFGLGYSGGAIPLAASNMILSVRDGVFSTIQPRSLANIARRLNLSWQECAKHVGLSPYELHQQGNIDGIIDYVPGENEKLHNLRRAIVTGISSVEDSARAFVADNPLVVDHYQRCLTRYVNPSAQLRQIEAMDAFGDWGTPTEFLNVFGVAYRYLRYLRVRRRIKSTSRQQYGRLAQKSIPAGELKLRSERDRKRTFLRWLQDPDRVIYDDTLRSAWSNFVARREEQDDQRGRLAAFVMGEPKRNYQNAKYELLGTVVVYLYNRWKTEATGNLKSLVDHLRNSEDSAYFFSADQVLLPEELIQAINADETLGTVLKERFSFDGKKILADDEPSSRSSGSLELLRSQLAVELNLAVSGGQLLAGGPKKSKSVGPIEQNRRVLNTHFGGLLAESPAARQEAGRSEQTVLDILLDPDLRDELTREIEQMQLLDAIYDELLNNLVKIAEEAERTQALERHTVGDLLRTAFTVAMQKVFPEKELTDQQADHRRSEFLTWYFRISRARTTRRFLLSVEEWKKGLFSHLSDTLFTIVTFYFERLLVSYIRAEREGSNYVGRINPHHIGRKRDFWNRLNIAYRDLRIQDVLTNFKRQKKTGYQAFIDTFFEDFEELYADRLSSDPCEFPGFRLSIEQALENNKPTAGVVTGVGKFKTDDASIRVGTVISNPDFQAGAFDMASAEKFCRLLVTCADEQLPLICFISSGGMQTKEGAGALFSMAAVNDRLTRFVRDFDLPVIVFGFGDCTGGAQASFVTHPLVHTYYFSGASMPFAGQIVIQSNLPSDSIIANYLASVKGAMQGLVKHEFHSELDDELRKIDPEIPVPGATVTQVVQNILSGVFAPDVGVVQPRRIEFNEADLYKPVRSVLVHARGCAAAKIVQVSRSMGLKTVLVQSEPDIDSVAVDLLDASDEVINIGGNTPDESYLNARSVLTVAENEGVDALHPGIGFLSENSGFAELVRSKGINFIGPPVVSMETMGNKSNAITTAMDLGVPVVPGSHGIVTDVDRAAEMAEQYGYPVLIKAVHGGGGKGIQVVESASQFHELFRRVTMEARAAFGNGDVYLEKFVTSLRHIEAQVLRDSQGNTTVLGIRDCSVQRNKQKVIEESGSTMLPEALLDDVLRHSDAIANAVQYVGAGTVEFIYDLANEAVYFMEMNTRLQVEHPVTELVSKVNIVSEQFRIASGASIAELEVADDGYAIEARVNAEKIARDANGELVFRSSAGAIKVCRIPEQEDITVITTAGEGKFISPYYDSMIMQIIAYGTDRNDAAEKLEKYLANVEIEGICTNIPLLKRVLVDEVFLEGTYDTTFLDGFMQRIDVDELIQEIQNISGIDTSEIGKEAIRIDGSSELKVLSPTTGIFYLKPSPSDPDYVSVNESIDITDTLCQLEAFKVFTPMKLEDFNTGEELIYPADNKYKIVRINVATGQQVNVGDLLFVVEPDNELATVEA